MLKMVFLISAVATLSNASNTVTYRADVSLLAWGSVRLPTLESAISEPDREVSLDPLHALRLAKAEIEVDAQGKVKRRVIRSDDFVMTIEPTSQVERSVTLVRGKEAPVNKILAMDFTWAPLEMQFALRSSAGAKDVVVAGVPCSVMRASMPIKLDGSEKLEVVAYQPRAEALQSVLGYMAVHCYRISDGQVSYVAGYHFTRLDEALRALTAKL